MPVASISSRNSLIQVVKVMVASLSSSVPNLRPSGRPFVQLYSIFFADLKSSGLLALIVMCLDNSLVFGPPVHHVSQSVPPPILGFPALEDEPFNSVAAGVVMIQFLFLSQLVCVWLCNGQQLTLGECL